MGEITIKWTITKEILTGVTMAMVMSLVILFGYIVNINMLSEVPLLFGETFLVITIVGILRRVFWRPCFTKILSDRTIIQYFRPVIFRSTRKCLVADYVSVKSYIRNQGKKRIHSLVLASLSGERELLLLERTPSNAFRYLDQSFDLPEFKNYRETISLFTGLKNGVVSKICEQKAVPATFQVCDITPLAGNLSI